MTYGREILITRLLACQSSLPMFLKVFACRTKGVQTHSYHHDDGHYQLCESWKKELKVPVCSRGNDEYHDNSSDNALFIIGRHATRAIGSA